MTSRHGLRLAPSLRKRCDQIQTFDKNPHFNGKITGLSLRNISENATKELKIHFVYAGWHYFWFDNRLRSFILNGMKKHKINSVMVTKIHLQRWKLITKEKMESYCNGEEYLKDSVNDDLESLFEIIQLGKEPNENVQTYCLPKLTEEELELVERRDTIYFQSFDYSWNPDVDETEMMLSESDSKYVYSSTVRETFVIENSGLILK